MLPILHSYLGFNTEMMSLITALYILFDPMITCVNILGNGAFAKIIDQINCGIMKGKKVDVTLRLFIIPMKLWDESVFFVVPTRGEDEFMIYYISWV